MLFFLLAMLFAQLHDIGNSNKVKANLSKCPPFLQGEIIFMKDNNCMNAYKYLVIAETGYRMYSSTDSNVLDSLVASANNVQIFFNVTGTDGEEYGRQMAGSDDQVDVFRWGTTNRFLMTTPWCGKLENDAYLNQEFG